MTGLPTSEYVVLMLTLRQFAEHYQAAMTRAAEAWTRFIEAVRQATES